MTTRSNTRAALCTLEKAIDPKRLGEMLCALAKCDYNGATLRTLLHLLGQAMRTDATNWAFPLESLAERTGLHRNAIGRALNALAADGIIQRKAVLHRGAPTRTKLRVAIPYVRTQPGVARQDATVQDPPHDDSTAAVDIVDFSGFNEASAGLAPPDVQDGPSDTGAASDGKSLGANAIRSEEGRAPGASSMSADERTAMMAFLNTAPQAVRDALVVATMAADPSQLRIDPAWELSDAQVRWLVAAVPRRDAPARPAPSKQRSAPRLCAAPAEIALALTRALPELTRHCGSDHRAATVADEIACMIVDGNLGRGNPEVGVRAGISLVARKQWQRPRLMTHHWHGAVLRGLAGPTERGVAHSCVH
jgi:hypothetical protein